jgi:hypothetical protein
LQATAKPPRIVRGDQLIDPTRLLSNECAKIVHRDTFGQQSTLHHRPGGSMAAQQSRGCEELSALSQRSGEQRLMASQPGAQSWDVPTARSATGATLT